MRGFIRSLRKPFHDKRGQRMKAYARPERPCFTFDFEDERLLEEVKKRGARRVALQLPEGLKPYAIRLAKLLEREAECTVFLLADPCYGPCDVAWREAEELGVDLLIHFGHSQYLPGRGVDTLYVECLMADEGLEAVRKAIPLLSGKRVGVCAILQHLKSLGSVVALLKEEGFEVHVASSSRPMLKPGQVIGCDYTCAKSLTRGVDHILFLGGGLMHPVGLRLSTGLPVVAVDPIAKEALDVEHYAKRVVARRLSDIALASEARSFGVIVGLKPGQRRLGLVRSVVNELRGAGREVVLLACREVSPSLEVNFPSAEAFVVTSCPLIALFDCEAFHKPILTPAEARLALTGGWRERYSDPFEGF
jgi:2-(3-amino-3-carboxypropyl)histidine synthase